MGMQLVFHMRPRPENAPVPIFGSHDITPGGWPEHGREDDALRELGRKLAPSDAFGKDRHHGSGPARLNLGTDI